MSRFVSLPIFLICFVSHFLSAQVLFKTNDFQVSRKELSLNGNCSIVDKQLRLAPAQVGQRGSAWFNQKLALKNGFETEFSFLLSGNDAAEKGGDGFTFIIQNSGLSALGNTGDDIGYKSIPHAVVFEFDTHIDADDKTRNQVALMEYDPVKNTYSRRATVHEIPELNDGQEHFARIEYKEGRLVFFLDSYLFPVLSCKIDIEKEIQSPDGWVGFTSATGKAYTNHDILSWSLTELPPPPEIKTENIQVVNTKVIKVKSRKLVIKVWDHNKIDGDIVSLKLDDKWLLTNYTLRREPKVLEYTLTGFKCDLVLYANNLGTVPPNTATIEIDDGHQKQPIKLESDMNTSEAVTLQYEE